MSKQKRISTEGGSGELSQNPFAGLEAGGLPEGPKQPAPQKQEKPKKSRGRLDLKREKKGRGGKTVTVIEGFKGMSTAEVEALGKKLRQACGTGGTVKDRAVELQGDCREAAANFLEQEGFRPVMAGG